MSQYTTTTLLSDIRSGAMLPAASASTFTDADVLRFADRAMQGGVVPMVMGAREEFFVTFLDVAISGGAQQYVAIPSRAIGGKLRDLSLLSPSNTYLPLPQLNPSGNGLMDSVSGFFYEGNNVVLWNPVGSWATNSARLKFFRRPSRLMPLASVGIIATITPSTKTVTVSPTPAGWATGAFDLVRAKPGYESLGDDLAATVTGGSMAFAAALPSGLAVGDYVCMPEETPVPQIPTELQSVLVQLTICKLLEAIGDATGLAAAKADLAELSSMALRMISPRADGSPKTVRNMSSPFRRKRRFLLY